MIEKGIAGAPGLTHTPGDTTLAHGGRKRRKFRGRAQLYQKARIGKDLCVGDVHVDGDTKVLPVKRKRPVIQKYNHNHGNGGRFGDGSGGVEARSHQAAKASAVGGALGYVGGTAAGSAAGRTVGATVGAAIGSFIAPGAGTTAGAWLGGAAGGLLGGAAGDAIGRKIAVGLSGGKAPEPGLGEAVGQMAGMGLGAAAGKKIAGNKGAAVGAVLGSAWGEIEGTPFGAYVKDRVDQVASARVQKDFDESKHPRAQDGRFSLLGSAISSGLAAGAGAVIGAVTRGGPKAMAIDAAATLAAYRGLDNYFTSQDDNGETHDVTAGGVAARVALPAAVAMVSHKDGWMPIGRSVVRAAQAVSRAAPASAVKQGIKGAGHWARRHPLVALGAASAAYTANHLTAQYIRNGKDSNVAKSYDFTPEVLSRKVKKSFDFTPEILKRDFTAGQRKKAAKTGAALPDGSFPIQNLSDLHNAISDVGRANDMAEAKSHIIDRAKALGLTDELPAGWSSVQKADDSFSLGVEFFKGREADAKMGRVWGWASVIEKDGKPVIDHQGDMIEPEELVKAAHDFITNSRTAGVMHSRADGQPVKIGHVVESVVLTRDLQKALGINLDRAGWLIGMQITDPTVKQQVSDGVLKSFSIGGKGRREEIV